jgi:hypothetical protein
MTKPITEIRTCDSCGDFYEIDWRWHLEVGMQLCPDCLDDYAQAMERIR